MQEDKVYTFLDGLDDRLDKIRGYALQIQLFPTVEHAYILVRRKDLRQSIMLGKDDNIHGVAMTSKGQKSQHQHPFQLVPNEKLTTQLKQKSQVEEGGCTHCGNAKQN